MFSRLVKTSVPSNYFIIPVIIITGFLSLFLGHFPVFVNSRSILLELIPQVFSSPVLSTVISLFFIILIAIVLIPFSSKYLHGVSSNILPSFIFITLSTSFCWVYNAGPVIISMYFGMLVFRHIFETYHLDRVFHFGFMAGFYSAIATLVYVPAITFVAISWMGFILLRTFKIREFVIIIIGFIVPVILTHSIFMITGEEKVFYLWIEKALVNCKPVFKDLKQITYVSIIGLLVVWSVLKAISSGSLRKIVLRRYFETFATAIIFLILVFLFLFSDFDILVLSFLPLSIIIAISITSVRKQVWASFILFLLIILQIISQLSFVL